jgi:ribokinase
MSDQHPPEVVVVGSLNLDLFFQAPRLPRPGETLTGSDFSVDQGGKGANQAVAARRVGARVAMVGRVGVDANGERLVDALVREGIDCGAIGREPGRPTGVAAITVATGGENSIVVVPGANHSLTPAHVEAATGLLGAARIVVVQLEVPLDAVAAALALAGAAGAQTLLNAAPAVALPDELLASLDWLVVNEGEAASLLGAPVDDLSQAVAAGEALRARGPKHVLVTLGGAGLVHADAHGTTHLAAPTVTAVDTTGAGDTFVGALAAALAQGLAPDAALRWGQAAAALAVTRRGTQSAMPTRADILARWPDPSISLASTAP